MTSYFSPPRAQISRAEKTNGGVAETDSQTMSSAPTKLSEVGEASIHEPFTRVGACSFVRGEQFYLFRGHHNLSRTPKVLEVLDLRTGLWSSLSTSGASLHLVPAAH